MHVLGVSVDRVAHSAIAPTSVPSTIDVHDGSSEFATVLRSSTAHNTTVVEARRTQLSTQEAQAALKSAWSSRFGQPPSEQTAAILTAQWSHETGNGHSMFNYNFGGIKGSGPGGLTVNQRTREGFGATEKTIVDNFRAYRSSTEGASDYLDLLHRKYPKAVEAAQRGEPAEFVRELKRGGYFTGNEAAYISSVERRTRQLLGAASLPPAQSETAAGDVSSTAPMASRQPLAQPSRHQAAAPLNELPRTFDLQVFDDALSRAALRIALGPHRSEENQS